MEDLTVIKGYKEYKEALDREMRGAAESFVRIGYLLRMAKDTPILQESGYSSVVDFAHAEYGIDKTQVSRFIRINEKFSEGGYSDRLQEKYKDFGQSKLAIMLSLPEEINKVLTPDMTREEITEVKREIEEEKQVSDIEVILEGRQEDMKSASLLEQALCIFFKDKENTTPCQGQKIIVYCFTGKISH